MITTRRSLRPLVFVTLTNYAALVPYYLHNDYFRTGYADGEGVSHHVLPGLRALLLVGLTLSWFVVGIHGAVRQRRWGRPVLLSFLVAEVALYAKTFATGAFVHQMQNPSDLVRAVFVIGYVSGAIALVYLALLGRGRPSKPALDDPNVRALGRRRSTRGGRGSSDPHRFVSNAWTC
jgi:NADH:ubiquinone oxidoreductase subunit K